MSEEQRDYSASGGKTRGFESRGTEISVELGVRFAIHCNSAFTRKGNEIWSKTFTVFDLLFLPVKSVMR